MRARGLEQLPLMLSFARPSSGFLKVEPNVLIDKGCASLRLVRISARVAHTSSGSALASASCAAYLPRPQVRAPVGEAELVGRALDRPGRGAHGDLLEHARELPSVGVRVHPHRAAHRARDLFRLRPARPHLAIFAAADGRRGALSLR